MPQMISASAAQALVGFLFLALVGTAAAQPRQAAAKPGALARLTRAVEGAESSHGSDPRMWRGNPAAAQGPMQVSAPAAADVGGGNRFDPAENIALGRAYLAYMYRRFGSWPDAVAAYNWGPGNLNFWIRSGRSPGEIPLEVERYRDRVLAAAELPLPKGAYLGEGWAAARRRPRLGGIAHAQPRRTGVAARAGIGYAEIASLYNEVLRASAPGEP